MNEAGHPIQARITAVKGLSSEAIGAWAREHLAAGSQVLPRRLLLPLQPALYDGDSDQVHGRYGVLLQATIKTLIDPIIALTSSIHSDVKTRA